MISIKDVEHVAVLARLELTDEEKIKFTEQMNGILEYADTLNKLDTTGVQPTYHPLPLKNVFREDEARASLSNEAATANAPEEENGYFKVPRIL